MINNLHDQLEKKSESFSDSSMRHQKLWKVQNPKLRQSLREAIIDMVITRYEKYLEDQPEQEICSSDPNKMEEMLNDLFEG
uniref:Exocyst complex subunit Exo70 C-terminal domain-containing protein n=1 Tax=Leersia perrieri TaxID=77586 RepID=A0A0D9WFR9_9ORYZ